MMKRLLSTTCPNWAFNAGMLILRIAAGTLMVPHGYDKLVNFSQIRPTFMNFLGLGNSISLGLVIFAEFFCALFIIFGLFTRLFTIPLIIAMAVALFSAHKGDFFGDGAASALYLACYTTLLLCGPGKVSIDGIMGK